MSGLYENLGNLSAHVKWCETKNLTDKDLFKMEISTVSIHNMKSKQRAFCISRFGES